MRSSAGIRQREGYAEALADLWTGLARTLAQLDALAATPAEQLVEDGARMLPRLQYDLHAASEVALGISAPAGTEETHDALTRALVTARDATAELLDAVEAGNLEAAAGLTYEWRAALFGVRLARLRLGAAARSAAFFERIDQRRSFRRSPLGAVLIVASALVTIVASATAGLSPLVTGGIVLLAVAALAARA